MTRDRYMARDQLHTQVADLLDRTVAKAVMNAESTESILKDGL